MTGTAQAQASDQSLDAGPDHSRVLRCTGCRPTTRADPCLDGLGVSGRRLQRSRARVEPRRLHHPGHRRCRDPPFASLEDRLDNFEN